MSRLNSWLYWSTKYGGSNPYEASKRCAVHSFHPVKNRKDIEEIDEEILAKAYKLAKKLAIVMTEVFQADGFNLLQNNNEAAGQSVFHFHIHLIPRYKGDNAILPWKTGEQDTEKLQAALEKLKTAL